MLLLLLMPLLPRFTHRRHSLAFSISASFGTLNLAGTPYSSSSVDMSFSLAVKNLPVVQALVIWLALLTSLVIEGAPPGRTNTLQLVMDKQGSHSEV